MHGTLALVHTVPPLVDVFARLTPKLLPGLKPMHILDEPLLEVIRRRGGLVAADADRLLGHVAAAEQAGALAALVTCSTVSPCVDSVRPRANIAVFKIDEAMIADAVQRGERIGVVATNQTTLEPTRRMLAERALATGAHITVELVLVEGALPALLSGAGETHDRLVAATVRDLARRSDVVVLAQASMARVLDVIPEADRMAPILSSPHLALAQVREHLRRSVAANE
jgi:Asp/Glu/hydantoin racemase